MLLYCSGIYEIASNANGEIVQENGVDKLVPVDAIRPSRWMNAWVWNDQIFIYEFDEDFIANDPDRFYISTPMEWQVFDPKWMQLMGLSETVLTKLNFGEITNGGKKIFQSKSLIFVLDEPDDVISFNPDFGADDDLTHRVMQDDLSLDSEIGLFVPASIGGVSGAQWTQLKIKQPTHELEVDVVLLVSPLNASNTSYHNFYKARHSTRQKIKVTRLCLGLMYFAEVILPCKV